VGIDALLGNAAISAIGGAAGQVTSNLINPCDAGNVLLAAGAGAVGGTVASRIPVRNFYTWKQARTFQPTKFGSLLMKPNLRKYIAQNIASGIVGLAPALISGFHLRLPRKL
jgi:hypothetical protein